MRLNVLKLSRSKLLELEEYYCNDLTKKNIPYTEFTAKKTELALPLILLVQ